MSIVRITFSHDGAVYERKASLQGVVTYLRNNILINEAWFNEAREARINALRNPIPLPTVEDQPHYNGRRTR